MLAYAEPNVHVIVLGSESWARRRPATTAISPTLEVAAVAHRVREDIAAQEFRRNRLPTHGAHQVKNPEKRDSAAAYALAGH